MAITMQKLEGQIDDLTLTIHALTAKRDVLRRDNTWPMDTVTAACRAILSAMLTLSVAHEELTRAHDELGGF